ncbi:preprotein translocase subunit YajC [Homoserinibacter sp. YIM 151385]|uniref:preprotein translocase subunit YajC n=1 Tax=Homoserinibacter sp. YIM 151385 TaxID=2985506 RepID=UPI0022EFFC41|nr:preprotein translocase subunit YajC [Homoserinibacter sp. YIM 151385]WBU38679.1 preprotein translocase subunit YajC [Homoserinibacter sp. YIM 151385]
MPIDPLTIGLFAVLAIMIFFMFRNSKKRQREAEDLRTRMVPGVEVMTQHGIYGTLVSLDAETNEAIVETTPGTLIRLHSQTLAKVVEEEAPLEDEADDALGADAALDGDPALRRDEPEFGERTDDPTRAPKKDSE